ncbi:hypothetical protein KOI35_26325 [Actinoplanes bogorensis]|uniref:Uncharacterized protein n=1 Tax=Paractinoplanes bogorensis TaxID=1610840 RepID=A0ABS5YU96_9ACTN|nr:hypothetical protein [Actinoplanes bogorensis]MBU2667034.1 hypothetical protein [Actinoplanes bogorensis]
MDENLADSDIAQERVARFGTLPPRIRPDDVVESVDTDSPQEMPGAAGTEAQRQVFLAGG